MPIGNNAAEIAAELERVSPEVGRLFALDDSFFSLVYRRTKKDEVSYRPEKIVFEVSSGVKWRSLTLDGDDMGRGGGPQLVNGSVAPVTFDWIIEWTKKAQYGTDSRVKSVYNYVQNIIKVHMDAAQNDLDSAMIYGDGANTIGVVTPNTNVTGSPFYTAGTPAIIYVDKAARFRQGADYDYQNGGTGTAITGTFTVTGVDYSGNALYVATSLTTAPVSGATIIVNNSSGVAGSGLNGVLDLNQTSSTGTFMGINKTTNPGSFNSNAINAQGATITPALARLLLNTMIINTGMDDVDKSDYLFMSDLGQKAAWENTAIAQTQVIQPGNATPRDMLPGTQIDTIGGIRFKASRKYIPGRIDLWNLNTLFAVEVAPLEVYSVADQTQFWPYGASGGIASAFLRYLTWVGNIGCNNPRKNAVIYNLAAPSGY